MSEILQRIGLREVRYQENYREEWRLAQVVFDFDTLAWPVNLRRDRRT
jgi:adenylate cyclase class 2